MQLTERFRYGLAMATPVRKSTTTQSGFVADEGTKQPLFVQARLEGYVAALRTGFVERLIVVGGEEGAYLPRERIMRPEVVCEMLSKDYNVDPQRLGWKYSPPHTKGVVEVMAQIAHLEPHAHVLLSSHFHIPRSLRDMRRHTDVLLAGCSVEALLLVEGFWTRERLLQYFGGGAYAQTVVQELCGIADDLRGVYRSMTEPSLSVV